MNPPLHKAQDFLDLEAIFLSQNSIYYEEVRSNPCEPFSIDILLNKTSPVYIWGKKKYFRIEIIKEFKVLWHIRHMVRRGICELGKITLVTLRYIWGKKKKKYLEGIILQRKSRTKLLNFGSRKSFIDMPTKYDPNRVKTLNEQKLCCVKKNKCTDKY